MTASVFSSLMGRLVTGIEDDVEEDAVRVYIDARWQNRYVLVGKAEGERLRREWGSIHHMFVKLPDDAIILEDAK